MSHEYITQHNVNINQYPSPDTQHWAIADKQITLGDLHGNALKLLYTLTRHGFIDISKRDYDKFVTLYHKKTLDRYDVQDFNAILKQIRIRTRAPQALLRLIGDVVADRGANDYFTLKILKKLRDNGVPVVNMISNHDAEFIECYEKGKLFDENRLGPQARSARNLQKLIDQGLIETQEVVELIKAYKPTLRALDYSLNAAKNKITIYSHGVIGLENINYIAEALGMNGVYCDEHSSAIEIAQIIEEINIRFAVHVKESTVSELLKLDSVDSRAINGVAPIDQQAFAFAHLVWNRDANGLKRPEHINFVHGHDMKDKTINNIFNLDNLLGKAPERHIGTYNSLFSNEITLRTQLTPPLTQPVAEITAPIPAEPPVGTILYRAPKPIAAVQPVSLPASLDEELEEGWVTVEAPKEDLPMVQNKNSGWFPSLTNWLWKSDQGTVDSDYSATVQPPKPGQDNRLT